MARTFRRKQSLGALSEINVTPLIDLAFALLIIFMITTPLLEQTIPLRLPLETANERPGDKERFQTISIDAEGQLYWGEEAVDATRLNALLESMKAGGDPPVISIRADASLPYQKVIDVLDLVKQNDLSRISLDTRVR